MKGRNTGGRKGKKEGSKRKERKGGREEGSFQPYVLTGRKSKRPFSLFYFQLKVLNYKIFQIPKNMQVDLTKILNF